MDFLWILKSRCLHHLLPKSYLLPVEKWESAVTSESVFGRVRALTPMGMSTVCAQMVDLYVEGNIAHGLQQLTRILTAAVVSQCVPRGMHCSNAANALRFLGCDGEAFGSGLAPWSRAWLTGGSWSKTVEGTQLLVP